jgi:hypothetical protein
MNEVRSCVVRTGKHFFGGVFLLDPCSAFTAQQMWGDQTPSPDAVPPMDGFIINCEWAVSATYGPSYLGVACPLVGMSTRALLASMDKHF